MATSRIRSSGFTLIELLVVIAIIGLLIGLLIPAIQASREAGRRVYCTNNLKQFGIAFLNFESQNRTFPAGLTARFRGPITSVDEGNLHGVFIDLLPFLEEGAIAAIYDDEAMFYAPQNAEAIAIPLSIALCPSSPADRAPVSGSFKMSDLVASSPPILEKFGPIFDLLDTRYSGTYRGACTDYAVPVKTTIAFANSLGYNVTDGFAELPGMFPLPPTDKILPMALRVILGQDALFVINEQTRARQITDGLTHTLMMAEQAGRPQHWHGGFRKHADEPLDCAWANPVAMGIFIQGEPVLQRDNAHEIYSFHPGGVNFLFADGHVDFLADDTNSRLIVGLMTPDHAEILD